MNIKTNTLATLALAATSAVSYAQCDDCNDAPFTITVTGVNCQDAGEVFTQCSDPNGTGDWELICSVFEDGDDNSAVFIIESDGTGPRIAKLTLQANETDGLCQVRVRGPSGDRFDIASIDEIVVAAGDHVGTAEILELKCEGDVGSIETDIIVDAQIQGDLTGGVTLLSHPNGDSDIEFLEVLGAAEGNITVEHGRIDVLDVEGDIGTSSTPVDIDVRDEILNIECGNLYADVTVQDGSTWKPMHRIEASTFDGALDCETIKSLPGGANDPELDVSTLDAQVTIHGDLGEEIMVGADANADIKINGELTGTIDINGELSEDTLIRIEGALKSAGSLAFATGGLVGQVIINAADDAEDWLGDATISTITIGPNESQPDEAPYYERSDADLGGGAIGLAPFNFHPKDSVPEHESTVTAALPDEVKIVHYGPVHTSGTLGGNIFTIEWTPIGGGAPTDVSNDFIVDASTSATGMRRDVVIEPKVGESFVDDRVYKITPKTSRLLCCHVDGCPDVDYDPGFYEFTIDLD